MRMTNDAEVWLVFLEERSSFLRQLPAFVQNMTDGDAAACRFDHGLGRNSALFIIIDIARDGGDRSDLREPALFMTVRREIMQSPRETGARSREGGRYT
jgi:hypothetical protein